ncbi:MAG: MotA/TolQ/ExbB proton channel family protein [Tunicatimonas sp.]|uniref:MotA/TolQ/ExbB proton channel family protein n=1 Tax=Tunicatimonas sp. TaxID=1940096 RepID=UPI003C78FB1E
MQQLTKSVVSVGFILVILTGFIHSALTQDISAQSDSTTKEVLLNDTTSLEGEAELLPTSEEDTNLHQVIREQFINGDWRFMAPVLLCLLIGMVIAIERIIRLNLATINVDKTLNQLRQNLTDGGVDKTLHSLQGKRNPIALIFRSSLGKWSEGIEMVEKAIISYGSVEMGKLEKGLVWMSLFISIAPMLGFMGTVIGMINAFDAIEAAGDISPTLVASGIKTALLTTVAGLIVAIILQLFYNYCVAKIDRIVNDMERASLAFVDALVDFKNIRKDEPKQNKK